MKKTINAQILLWYQYALWLARIMSASIKEYSPSNITMMSVNILEEVSLKMNVMNLNSINYRILLIKMEDTKIIKKNKEDLNKNGSLA